MTAEESLNILKEGNRKFYTSSVPTGDISPDRRHFTADRGQQPNAILITCCDARILPEAIFSTGIGDLLSFRIPGNVLTPYLLSSVKFAARQFGAPLVILMGHTHCDTLKAALTGHMEGFLASVNEELKKAAGPEKDLEKVCRLNVRRDVQLLREIFRQTPELAKTKIVGAIYNIDTGEVRWI